MKHLVAILVLVASSVASAQEAVPPARDPSTSRAPAAPTQPPPTTTDPKSNIQTVKPPDEPAPEAPAPQAPPPATSPARGRRPQQQPKLDADEVRIVDVTVEGVRRVDPEAVLAVVKSRAGAALDPVTVTTDLRSIWATGFFRDVRAETEPGTGGVRLVFVVVERPAIQEVKYVGLDDLGEDDMKPVVDVKPYTILNVDQLKRNVEKIKDLYVEKGYFLAQVRYRVEPVDGDDGEVNVVFEIQENAKVIVKHIAFIGNKTITDDAIKNVLQTREGNEISFLSQSGTYKREFFETDMFRIQALYYDNGFVSVKVGEPSATISPDRRYIYLSVPIEEGEQYDIGKVTFSGDVELKDETGKVVVSEDYLRGRLTIGNGELFNRTKLFADIQAVTDAYRDQGYAYTNVNPLTRTDPKTRTVDLELQVQRGDLVYFERIDVVGNTKTRDKVIRREMRVFEGDKYSATGIARSKARIYQLGYFETVEVTTNRGSRPDTMNVQVEIKEKSTGTFQVGAGFSSVESFIATMQISQNNFLGNGNLLSLSAQLSFGTYARQLATFDFIEPYFLDTRWQLGFKAYITKRFYQDFARSATGFSPTLGYPLTLDWRVNFGYTLERIQIDEVGGGRQIDYENLNNNGMNSAFNASIAYDTRDNRLFPRSGHYHILAAEVSNKAWGSNTSLEYQRFTMNIQRYVPLPFNFTLKFRGQFGYITGNGEQGVQISERFFPGGIYSVRGFNPRSLGPRVNVGFKGEPLGETTEFVRGGNKEVVFNLELEFPILTAAGIKGVLFTDAGNAYDDNEGFFYLDTPRDLRPNAYLFNSTDPIKPPLGLFYSFGFGLRWLSPIGPLRFEWGIPITKVRPQDRSLIFEFTIGNFF